MTRDQELGDANTMALVAKLKAQPEMHTGGLTRAEIKLRIQCSDEQADRILAMPGPMGRDFAITHSRPPLYSLTGKSLARYGSRPDPRQRRADPRTHRGPRRVDDANNIEVYVGARVEVLDFWGNPTGKAGEVIEVGRPYARGGGGPVVVSVARIESKRLQFDETSMNSRHTRILYEGAVLLAVDEAARETFFAVGTAESRRIDWEAWHLAEPGSRLVIATLSRVLEATVAERPQATKPETEIMVLAHADRRLILKMARAASAGYYDRNPSERFPGCDRDMSLDGVTARIVGHRRQA